MYETFADGVYWDNFFLQPSYVPSEAGGPGYVDDDGKPRPGVNLMGFRSLAKRNAVMMHMLGKRPVSYLHMTNTNIVPMLSFGTINLDWEWRDHGGDLQDRLGADQDTALILAQSVGLQSGNISVAINRFNAHGGKSQEWLMRTAMAVCFPHEMKIQQGTAELSFAQTQLTKFGYGEPDCKVYRYWEDGFPLKVKGANVHALVLARDGKAMLAVGNYGSEATSAAASVVAGQPAPTLQEYDAAQLTGKGGAAMAASGGAKAGSEIYTVTLTLDLKALGLPKTANAFDVELKAGRKKSEDLSGVKTQDTSAGAKNPEKPLAKKEAATATPDGGKDNFTLKRKAPGVFELRIARHDFALIQVE